MDEPTNDFDIDTLNVLEDFLEKFNGCLVLVSHDRYFMDHLVEELFIFEGDGVIRPFNGNYSDYRTFLEEKENVVEEKPKPAAIKEADQSDKRKLSFKEKQEFESLQKEIQNLEGKKDQLSNTLNSGITDHVKLQELATQILELTNQIESKTFRWLELAEFEK